MTYGTGRMPWDICDDDDDDDSNNNNNNNNSNNNKFIQPYVDVEDQMKPRISIASIQMDCSHNSIPCYTNYSTEYCPVN